MCDLTKKAAYIKGLLDGMKLDESKDETKILKAMGDFIENAAEQVRMIFEVQGYIVDDIDEIMEVIGDFDDDLEDYDSDDGGLYQIKCDSCGCNVRFTDDDIDDLAGDGIECPSCGEIIKLDLDDFDDFDDCGCGCDHNHDE